MFAIKKCVPFHLFSLFEKKNLTKKKVIKNVKKFTRESA